MNSIWWLNDYRTIRDQAGVLELPEWSRIELRGEDRLRLANSLATNRLDDLHPGQGRETFLTDVRGHVLAHGTFIAEEESASFLTPAPRGDRIVAHIQRYIVREDVQVADPSVQTAIWYLGGRQAELFLEQLEISPPREPGAHAEGRIGDAAVTACRVEITGPVGFLLIASRDQALAIALALQEAGAKTCVREAFEAARIQSGWPLDRVDISLDNFPQEVGRDDQAISFTKGCYLGQETVARIASLGHVNKHLSVLRFPPGTIAPGATLSAGGKPVGITTSIGYSPESDCPIALAYVRREWAEAGTTVSSTLGPAEIIAPCRILRAGTRKN